MLSNDVWVVSYCFRHFCPIVSVYDNEDAARAFYDYVKEKYASLKGDFVLSIDKCPIYSTFEIVKKGE